jgi:MFS superfamily sulfate permease-like transporter
MIGLVIGILTTIALYYNKQWRQRFKARSSARTASSPPLTPWETISKKYVYPMSNVTSLLAVVITTIISYLIHTNSSFRLPIVGNVPAGFKVPAWPSMNPEVIPGAFMIGIISFAGIYSHTYFISLLYCYQLIVSNE